MRCLPGSLVAGDLGVGNIGSVFVPMALVRTERRPSFFARLLLREKMDCESDIPQLLPPHRSRSGTKEAVLHDAGIEDDPRTLWVDIDPRGHRRKEWREVWFETHIALLLQLDLYDTEGRARRLTSSRPCGELVVIRWNEQFLRDVGFSRSDRTSCELRVRVSIFKAAGEYDLLKLGGWIVCTIILICAQGPQGPGPQCPQGPKGTQRPQGPQGSQKTHNTTNTKAQNKNKQNTKNTQQQINTNSVNTRHTTTYEAQTQQHTHTKQQQQPTTNNQQPTTNEQQQRPNEQRQPTRNNTDRNNRNNTQQQSTHNTTNT